MANIENYAFTATTELGFEETIEKVTALLADQGFGILSEIDVQATLKKKLDVDYKPYKILGACNPPFAHKSLEANELIGVFLPCNVVVWDNGDNRTISAMNPRVMSDIMDNVEIDVVAAGITEKLKNVFSQF